MPSFKRDLPRSFTSESVQLYRIFNEFGPFVQWVAKLKLQADQCGVGYGSISWIQNNFEMYHTSALAQCLQPGISMLHVGGVVQRAEVIQQQLRLHGHVDMLPEHRNPDAVNQLRVLVGAGVVTSQVRVSTGGLRRPAALTHIRSFPSQEALPPGTQRAVSSSAILQHSPDRLKKFMRGWEKENQDRHHVLSQIQR
ncbi:hypothetical protein B0H11DRAFT_1914168 [Mycena galericulata]|nr:hypothetical protein B0H11DRAFT_1914168 [Mycena galericulata]